MSAEIRPAREADLAPVAATLRSAGLGANVGRLLEFPFESTGWIGALGVIGAVRRRGLGTALTEAAVDWLRDHGAQTVLLYATEAGRPVYTRVGFVADGEAHAWRDVAPPPPAAVPAGIRAL